MHQPAVRTCPSCSVELPPKATRFCPACGGELAALAPELPRSPSPQPGAPPSSSSSAPMDETFEVDTPAPMAVPLALAAGGAALGAMLWAGIAYVTGMEIGYVAWAVGGLCGGGMLLGGGRSGMHAIMAAAMALLGIAMGKYFGTDLLIEHQLRQLEQQVLTVEAFDNMRETARRMIDMPAPSVESSLAAADEFGLDVGEDAGLSEAEVAELRAAVEENRQQLLRMLDEDFTYEQWLLEQRVAIRAEVPVWDAVVESLGVLDILFVLLGLSTAFGVVQRAGPRQVV